jgi:hypothetical protein
LPKIVIAMQINILEIFQFGHIRGKLAKFVPRCDLGVILEAEDHTV